MLLIAFMLLAQAPDPSVRSIARIVLNAAECACDDWRKITLDDIATEQKYARIGGAVNLARLYALQGQLRGIDDQKKAIVAGLSRLHLRPSRCAALVKRVAECTTI